MEFTSTDYRNTDFRKEQNLFIRFYYDEIILIMRTFIAMRQYFTDNALVFQRLDRIELKQLETDNKVNQLFKQLETPGPDKAIIFFKGQMWDATSYIEEIISKAEKSIILIDGYVDRNTLDMLTGKKAFEISLNEDEKLLEAILQRL